MEQKIKKIKPDSNYFIQRHDSISTTSNIEYAQNFGRTQQIAFGKQILHQKANLNENKLPHKEFSQDISSQNHPVNDFFQRKLISQNQNGLIDSKGLANKILETFWTKEKIELFFQETSESLQYAQINSKLDVERNFNKIIFEIEAQKTKALESVKCHFTKINQQFSMVKAEISILTRNKDLKNLKGNFVIQSKIEKIKKEVLGKKFSYSIQSNGSYFKNIFRIKTNEVQIRDDPNLLSISVENDRFSLSSGRSKNDLSTNCQKTYEKNELQSKQNKTSVKFSVSSKKNKIQPFFENKMLSKNEIYSGKINPRSTRFLPQDLMNIQNRSNKENLLVGKMKTGYNRKNETPKFIQNAVEEKQQNLLQSSIVYLKKDENQVNLSDGGFNCREIAEFLQSGEDFSKIKILNISNNEIKDKGLRQILKRITNLNFETIICNNISATNLSIDYLLSFLKYNKTLKLVLFKDNKIEFSEQSTIKKLKKINDLNVNVVLS